MSDLYNRIAGLCEQQGITITAMCKDSGASRASLSDLKVGRKQSLSAETLDKIANYFNTTVDYLLGRTNDPENSDRFGLEDPSTYFYYSYMDKEEAPTPEGEREIEDPDIRMIARAGKKMTPEQRKNLRKYAQYMFPEAFEDDHT